MDVAASAGERSVGMPSAASTSALPLLLVMARLPCLATVTPAAAQRMATVVEMLNVFNPSPPVPQTSRMMPARVVSSNGTAVARARSSLANAANSSAVSPFSASAVRKSALASGGMASAVIWVTESVTCSAVKSEPARSDSVNEFNMRIGLRFLRRRSRYFGKRFVKLTIHYSPSPSSTTLRALWKRSCCR